MVTYLVRHRFFAMWVNLHCSVAFRVQSIPRERFLSVVPTMNLCGILKAMEMKFKE